MDASQDDLNLLFPIYVGDLICPEGRCAEDGDSNEINVLEIPLGINGGDEIVRERDVDLGGGEGRDEGQGEVGNAGIFLGCWRDEFQFQRPSPDTGDVSYYWSIPFPVKESAVLLGGTAWDPSLHCSSVCCPNSPPLTEKNF